MNESRTPLVAVSALLSLTTAWQKMARVGGGGTPQFLSTHPYPENRIADLQSYSVKVMPLYERARRR